MRTIDWISYSEHADYIVRSLGVESQVVPGLRGGKGRGRSGGGKTGKAKHPIVNLFMHQTCGSLKIVLNVRFCTGFSIYVHTGLSLPDTSTCARLEEAW